MPPVSIITTAFVLVIVIAIVGTALYKSISRSSRAKKCSMCPHSSECTQHRNEKCDGMPK